MFCSVGTRCVQAFWLSKMNSLANHLRADAFALPVRADGKDMDDGDLIVTHLPRLFYRVIVLTLIHRDCHRPDDATILTVQIHAPLLNISLDAFFRRMLAFAPSGVCGHLWRALRHVIIESDDGVEVVLSC